jgi:acyl carrier protein
VRIPALTPAPTRGAIEEWMVDWIARQLGLPPGEIEAGKSLMDYSLSSVTAMMLVGDLEEWLGLVLPPTLAWDYPSIAAIADYLTEQLAARSADAPAAAGPVNGEAPAGDPLGRPGGGAELHASLDQLSDQEVEALLSRMMADERAAAGP